MDYGAALCYWYGPEELVTGSYFDVLPVGILGRSVLVLVLKLQ